VESVVIAGIPRRPSPLSTRRVRVADIGTELRLVGPAAWAIFGLFAAVYLYIAPTFGGSASATPLGVGALIGFLACGALVVSPSRTPLPVWRTIAVVVIVEASVAALTWQLPAVAVGPGLKIWDLGAGNFLLFALALRGRVRSAWIGELAMIGLVCIWSTQATGSPLFGLAISYGQPVSLLAGTIFAVALRRTAERILDFRAAEGRRAAAEGRDSTENDERDRELQLVRNLAEPTLSGIASGETPDRAGVRALEAELRDGIRGRALAVEPLTSTLRKVRASGVDVVVLDDLGEQELDESVRVLLADWCVSRVATLESGIVMFRLAMHGGQPRVTVAVDGSEAGEFTLS
jgi:hypothetical protein